MVTDDRSEIMEHPQQSEVIALVDFNFQFHFV